MPEMDKGTPVDPGVAKASLPPTEVERKKAKFAALSKEDDAARSDRRANELKTLVDTHFANVASAHDMYPTPAVSFVDMAPDDQRRWNDKSKDVAMATRAYHLAVKRVCADHREEDTHLAKLRFEAAAKTA